MKDQKIVLLLWNWWRKRSKNCPINMESDYIPD